jgi:hypothetical protein
MERCLKCKKKTLLTFNCKCLGKFCMNCKIPEIHMCSFDYKKEQRDKLEKSNPIIINIKFPKI